MPSKPEATLDDVMHLLYELRGQLDRLERHVGLRPIEKAPREQLDPRIRRALTRTRSGDVPIGRREDIEAARMRLAAHAPSEPPPKRLPRGATVQERADHALARLAWNAAHPRPKKPRKPKSKE